MLAKWRRDIAKDGVDAVIEENMLNKTEEDNRSWRSGDMSAVEEDHEEMKREAPAIYEKGVVERNHKWMTKLKHALEQKEDVMVLVGVDHLGGKDGLLHLLTEAGFAVEQMYGVDSASPASSREPNLPSSPKSHRAEPLGSDLNR
jgi:pheromone shutdown protein TraB